jgi:hypothetical protein
MKNLYFLFVLLTGISSHSVYAQWTDPFSDGNLHQNPTWFGDSADFMIVNERLQLNAFEAGSSSLYTTFLLDDPDAIEWHFDLELAFAPSQNNGCKIYLFALDSNLWISGESDELSYFLKIGESGAMDAVELYKSENSSTEPILLCRGNDGSLANSFHKKFKIRYENDLWKIYSAPFDSPYYTIEAQAADDQFSYEMGFVGMKLNYTSSNTANFLFDDIAIQEFIEDVDPPSIESVNVVNDTQLMIIFSEAVDSLMLENENYFINEMLAYPLEIEFFNTQQSGVLLHFDDPFLPWTELHLSIESITDIEGNNTSESILSFYYQPDYLAQKGELVFSEILSDPSPEVALANAEFIELFNTSDSTLSLENYSLWNSGQPIDFPPYSMEAGSYLIVCKSSNVSLFNIENVLGLDDWISLLNTGDSLLLKNSAGELLDYVYYVDDWFESPLKKEGGWSLEKVDLTQACYGESNWKESLSIYGGTPGMQNSRYGEPIINEVLLGQARIVDSNKVEIRFSGEIKSTFESEIMTSVSPPFEPQWQLAEIENNSLLIPCNTVFQPGIAYHLLIHNLRSCNEETVEAKELRFAFPELASCGDVVINELLFNAYTGANDFIEIINRSEKFIDLNGWRINEIQGEFLVEDARIIIEPLLLAPGEILAISKDVEELQTTYPTSRRDNLMEVNDLPSFNDDEGKVQLVNANLMVVDSLVYSEEMHFQLLDDLNGVSIERIHPNRNSGDKASWTSASKKSGFATPGYQNSHYWEGMVSKAQIRIEPQFFTPNNDGDMDQLFIYYELADGGWQGSITIYDRNGIEVKELLIDEWIESKGVFKWDGLNNKGEIAPVGIYVVSFEVFNAKGEIEYFKGSCVLGAFL